MDGFPKLINSKDNTEIIINNSNFQIGRSLNCDHIIDSIEVSRFHCTLKKSSNKWMLHDRSSNGTYVNSKFYKLTSTDLNHGDVVKFGNDSIEFRFFSIATPPLNEEIVITDDLVEEFEKPFEPPVPAVPVAQKQLNEVPGVEDELTCSICSEMFVKAVTLNCSHSFCSYCIEQWRSTKETCPICRKNITSSAPTLVLDNFIEKYFQQQTEDVKTARQLVVQERIVVPSSSNTDLATTPDVVEVDSDDDDDDEDDNFLIDDEEDDNYIENDYYTDDEYYSDCDIGSIVNGAYYGGYGRCYICNQSGHWANGCPLKRR